MAVSEKQKTLVSDLNLLINQIAFINDMLDMGINPDLFRSKIIDDIFFVNDILNRLERSLESIEFTENEFFPVLKKFKNVKDNLIMLIDNILRYKYRQSAMLDLITDDLNAIAELNRISSREIQKKLGKRQFLSQPDNQISRQELHLLFLNEDSSQD